MKHTLQWFKNRIGKRIYRLTFTNCCESCSETYKKGVVISDVTHADYVYTCQNEMNLEYDDKPRKNEMSQ